VGTGCAAANHFVFAYSYLATGSEPAAGYSEKYEVHMSEIDTTQQESDQKQRLFTFRTTQWIWLILGVVEIIIGLRVLLLLIGANPASPFAALIYNLSDMLLVPFAGLVGTPAAGGMVLEISSIIAMLVYALLAWGIDRLIWVIFYRPRM
jgi:uncharacterized membrane protein YkgB